MHRISRFLMAGAAGILTILALAGTAHADTVIDNGFLNNNAVWISAGSPYIIEDTVTIPSDRSLIIDPGVTLIGSSSIQGYPAIYVQGSLTFRGQKESPIKIGGFGGIAVENGSTSLMYSDISLLDGISVIKGYAHISSSTISGAYEGIRSQNSRVTVIDSFIHNNQQGILISPSLDSVFQAREHDSLFGIGGLGNALEPSGDSATYTLPSSQVTVSRSSLINNAFAAVHNSDTQIANLADNWWGSGAGPMASTTNALIGPAVYTPWLMTDPAEIHHSQTCCSSILFIPGLEGTRLFRPVSVPAGLGTLTRRLWEPITNNDVTTLYLDSNGSSTDSTIYSNEPIDMALGLKDVYGSFMNFLDHLVSIGMVKEWKAFGYDWRKPISEVVAGVEKRATTTESLVKSVTDLALRSRTGKVTLVAHSNGGLIAKYLVKVLSDLGQASLIDSVISVGVPYLGTPEAIAGLLHGDDQSIGWGLIASAATARGLGKNMASAYSLLPSAEYFKKIFSPTIAFASTTMPGLNDGSYPVLITDHTVQNDFITNVGNKRALAAPANVSVPLSGNPALMVAADVIHGVLDPFSWPASIARWAIVGWNAATTKGIVYENGIECRGLFKLICNVPTHIATTTLMGDGTVVAPSAAYNAGTIVSADLRSISVSEDRNIKHANILGASTTQAAITDIIDNSGKVISELTKIPGISIGEPDYAHGEPSFLKISTHSPVELHVYDERGRHTGIVPLPPQLDVEDRVYDAIFEENIIGSTFRSSAGSGNDPEYQVYLPDDNDTQYTITLKGIGVGLATLDIERVRNGSYLDKVEYADLPVTPLLVATTTVRSGRSDAEIPQRLASSSPVISLDVDGDDLSDLSMAPNTAFDPIIWLESFKKSSINLASSTAMGKVIARRIDRIETLFKSGRFKPARAIVNQFAKKIRHLKARAFTDADRIQTIDLIDRYLAQLE